MAHYPDQSSTLAAAVSALLTQRETAAVLRLSERTLERLRRTGEGPVFLKLGRRVVYRADDLRAWTGAKTRRSTSEYDR